jgi:hypothetical protein
VNRGGRQPKVQHHTDVCQHCGATRAEVRSRQKAASDHRRLPWAKRRVQPLLCTRTDGRRSHEYQPRAVYTRAT